MKNETYLDFCFIREEKGNFSNEIHHLFNNLFSEKRLNWFLDEKIQDGLEIVVAEVKGMSDWESEQDLLHYLEKCAATQFWTYLQGYQLYIYPYKKGCHSCGLH